MIKYRPLLTLKLLGEQKDVLFWTGIQICPRSPFLPMLSVTTIGHLVYIQDFTDNIVVYKHQYMNTLHDTIQQQYLMLDIVLVVHWQRLHL